MKRTDTIAIFDIGKTNKKVFLFNKELVPVYQHEECFTEVVDEDGFPCDDISAISKWVMDTISDLRKRKEFLIQAVNFSTYGASMMHIGQEGNPLTPLYNYLKPMPSEIPDSVYKNAGGVEEFSRQTASPSLGFLNSGLQLLWLKMKHPGIFQQRTYSLHLPQYFVYLFTGKAISEYTSIGCHTGLWDFDNMKYHYWLDQEGIHLPSPVPNQLTFRASRYEGNLRIGTGIHDSSASLAPYLIQCKRRFILLSTGTWCITINPFNHESLKKEQLENDCLCYLSIHQKPVKSSRYFMGHFHDTLVGKISEYYHINPGFYKSVTPDPVLLETSKRDESYFFDGQNPVSSPDMSAIPNAVEAYHIMMAELTARCARSVKHVIPEKNDVQDLYISGGFSKNRIFIHYLGWHFPDKTIYTTDFENSSALGAAMMISHEFGGTYHVDLNLGLKHWL